MKFYDEKLGLEERSNAIRQDRGNKWIKLIPNYKDIGRTLTDQESKGVIIDFHGMINLDSPIKIKLD